MGDLGLHFDRREFSCRCGCGADNVEPSLVSALDALREAVGGPIVITSGVRCREHNRAVGGTADSAHLLGLAADVGAGTSQRRFEILKAVFSLGLLQRIGVGRDFIHLDLDGRKPRRVLWTY